MADRAASRIRVSSGRFRECWKYVREEKALTLEDAVRKMTSKPAEVFGFERRGVLKAGNFADIVVFNPDTIIDKGTFEQAGSVSRRHRTCIG